MSQTIHHLTELSWVELEALDKDHSFVLVPLSPIEEHGPHLPLGTDIFGAQDIAELTAVNVCEQKPELLAVLAPAIPLGCSSITADFPGTISLRGETLYNLLIDFCTGLAKSGFKYIVIVNHHLDSVHLKAILEAIDTVCETFNVEIIETAGRLLYSGIPIEEVREGEKLGLSMKTEIHADVRETSFIKYRYPHLVKSDPEKLPPVLIDIKRGLEQGCKTFKAMGASQGYLGTPALASVHLGKIHLEEQARLTADMVIQLVNGLPLPEMSPGILKYLKEHVRL
jgi:creatinine amidohydrolase